MKKIVCMLVTLVVTMFSLNALAYTPPAAPANGGYVVDQAGKLSSSQIQQLNQKIDRISKSTKNEFGILLLQDMGGENIEDVANATYKGWGVGKRGLDNGCLIVVAIKERKSRIETGKGVEGEIPDLKANDILKQNLNPHLKNGDFFGAFDDTLNALSSQMESRQGQKADPAPASTRTGSASCDINGGVGAGETGTLLVVLSAGFVAGLVWYLRAKAKRREEELRQLEEEANEAKRRLAREAENYLRLQEEKRKREEKAEAERKRMEAERKRMETLTPIVPIPVVPPRQISPSRVVRHDPVSVATSLTPAPRTVPRPSPRPTYLATTAVATAVTADVIRRQREEAETRSRREEEERQEARRRREREEEDRRRRDREDEDRRRSESSSSSSSSSSSFDWGSSGSSGGFDSGGGFGGGDSGGGGSSSDW